MSDRNFLIFIYKKLSLDYHEELDFMRQLRAIIANTPFDISAPEVSDSIEDLIEQGEIYDEDNSWRNEINTRAKKEFKKFKKSTDKWKSPHQKWTGPAQKDDYTEGEL